MKFVTIASLLVLPPFALADIATFDDVAEGTNAVILTNGGITFSDLFVDLPQGSGAFVVEDASGPYAGLANFSSPNVLNFGGFDPGGEEAGFNPFTSFWMSNGKLSTSISVDLFLVGAGHEGDVFTLEVYRSGSLVGSDSFQVDPSKADRYGESLSLTGVEFDSARLVGSGGEDHLYHAHVDNVRISAVPEPASLAALALGSGLLATRKRRTIPS